MYNAEPFCFVCNRNTDHFAEHDAIVMAGLAEYRGLTVVRTDLWDDDEAAAIAAQEYSFLYGELEIR